MSTTIPSAIESGLRRCGLLHCRLVAGVSGGPDSVALLLGLIDRREALGLDLVVAHFDHGLRVESTLDADFVRDLAHALAVEFVADRADPAIDGRRPAGGIEERGRRRRYDFFADVVHRREARAVVIGHTADDQTETRLLHLARGSGLHGLVGMDLDTILPLPTGDSVRVVRPLLGCTREETATFCRSRGVVPRVDRTNDDLQFSRNRLRQQVVPALRQINQRVDAALERLAQVAADADDFIASELDRRLPELVSRSADRWQIDRAAWRQLPRALKQALLLRAASALGRTSALDADHVTEAVKAIDRSPAGTTLSWPGRLTLQIEFDRATLTSAPTGERRLDTAVVDLTTDSITALAWCDNRPGDHGAPAGEDGPDRWSLAVLRRSLLCHQREGDRWHIDLDRAKLGYPTSLVVRQRKVGDRFAPVGTAGTKKVQDLLVDLHVPRAERDSIPIVATPDGQIAWIAGHRGDRRFLADADSDDVLCLKLKKGERSIVQAQR
jgi:tRNA(Ile)-lysidine synthase